MSPTGGLNPDAPSTADGRVDATTASIGESGIAATVIDRYHLLQKIGEGGMGEVWLAEQKEPVRRRVALKLIKAGMNTRQVIARFESERQALALMNHPAIAKVFDAGTTPQGMPFFVMEYVAGVPITTYCDNHRLNTASRLELFMRVCDGVQHAHQKAIIHRDLKPSNILVAEVDGKPAPKIIDFGVAKALTQKLTADTLFTQVGAIVGTPEYMSPEQALTSGEDIDTRSDVYSLGIVLYELMVGAPPIELRKAALDEFLRRLREEDPPKPSTKIRTKDKSTSADLARKRQTSPEPLIKQLRGDLDSIALKALEKDRSRRYASASDLAADIMRYLRTEPVLAAPPSSWYRSSKFARRHWRGLLAASLTLFAICVGAGVSIYQARLARQRFQQVRKLAHSFVFDYHDELAHLEGSTSLREKMVRTGLEYVDSLAHGAGNDPDLQVELAAAYRKLGDAQGFPGRPNLGHVDQALVSYRKAATIYDQLAAREPKFEGEVGEFYSAYTALLSDTGRLNDAARTGQIALRATGHFAATHPNNESAQVNSARAWNLLGDLDDEKNDAAAALDKYRRAETIAHAVLNRWRNELSWQIVESSENRVGPEAAALGRFHEAVAGLRQDEEALANLVRLAPRNPEYLGSRATLAEFWSQIYDDDIFPSFEDPDRAMLYCREMLEHGRNLVLKDPGNAAANQTLAVALYRLAYPLSKKDAKAAVEAAQESLRLFDEEIAAGKSGFLVTSQRARALLRLAQAQVAAGLADEARKTAAQAYAEERVVAGADGTEPIDSRMVLALLASARASDLLHDRKTAEDALSQALALAEKIHNQQPKSLTLAIPIARVRRQAAEYWQKSNDRSKAAQELQELRNLWQTFPADNDYVALQRSLVDRLARGNP